MAYVLCYASFMAKRKKRATRKPKFPPPLNMSNFNDMRAIFGGCLTFQLSPLFGTLTIVTPIGHYDFIIEAEVATELSEALDDFLSGASPKLSGC